MSVIDYSGLVGVWVVEMKAVGKLQPHSLSLSCARCEKVEKMSRMKLTDELIFSYGKVHVM